MKRRIQPLREKSSGELNELLLDLQGQYFRRRFTADPKRIQNPGKFMKIRRDIARIKTILKEKQEVESEK